MFGAFDRRQAMGLMAAWTADALPTNAMPTGQNALGLASLADARSQVDPAAVIVIAERGGAMWRRVSVTDALPLDERDFSWFDARAGVRYALLTAPVPLEAFGCVGDYDERTGTGMDNSSALQAAFNYARRVGACLTSRPGAKYLTDTIYCHYDPVHNPVGKELRPGRIALSGQASGIATGTTEASGCALVHKSNSRGPLLSCIGRFSVADPGAMGGQIYIDRFNFLGGYDTTDVLYFEACEGQIWLSNYTVRVLNPAGNGITENSTWETVHLNGLIRGPGRQLYPSDPGFHADKLVSGIGLNILDNGAGGQVNMKIYQNVNCYGNGYGVRVGRRQGSGTFGPLIFIGGQASHCDHHGVWIDGGVLSLSAIGYQIENTRLNGLRIDSAGASDLPRSIRWQNGYFASCGRSSELGPDSFAVHIVDGEGVELDMPVFQGTNSGIIFDRSRAFGLDIRKPALRTTSAWGAENGTFISAYGHLEPSMRISLQDPVLSARTSQLIDASAHEAFARAAAGEVLAAIPQGPAPSLTLSFRSGAQAARILQLHSPHPTELSDIADGAHHQMLLLEFQDANTIVRHGSSVSLDEERDFVPADASATLMLYRDGTRWREIARSGDRHVNRWRCLRASAQPIQQRSSAPLIELPFDLGRIGIDGAVTLEMALTVAGHTRLEIAVTGWPRWTINLDPGGHELDWQMEGRGSPVRQLVRQRLDQSRWSYTEAEIDMRQGSGILLVRAEVTAGADITVERHEVRLRTGNRCQSD